ncbi:MAG: sulfatase-like hydrolase/transferase [Verrucomicrobiota bacterium]
MRLVLALFALGQGTAMAAPNDARPPNIVFILLDNLGQEWLGCYGSEERCTPNIDALAKGGVRFEHCYTAPVCGPSRIVLLTGRYPFRTGFTIHHDAALYSGGGLPPERETVFARVLRRAGYATGIAGKWQINNLYDEPNVLKAHGFDEHLVWPGSIDTNKVRGADYERYWAAVKAESVPDTVQFIQHIESRYWDPVLIRNGKRETHPGKFGPDVLQSFALDFLRRHRDERLLLYYPMTLTHGQTFTAPVVPTPLNMNTNRTRHEMFADMVRYADKLVGDLIRTLDELKLRDNTIIFVATDNGTEKEMIARRNGRDVKGALYQLTEPGGDVGLLVNCPARIPGGRTIALADFTDVFPTICELARVPLPPGLLLDGRSHASALLRPSGARPARQWIFNQYHTRRVVRDERYKLYSTGEFYDLARDGDEQRNLAGSGETGAAAAQGKLQAVLDSLPPDASPPFRLMSQSGFNLRAKK